MWKKQCISNTDTRINSFFRLKTNCLIHVYGYGVLVAADIDTNVRGSESWFKFYVQKNDHS